MENKQLYRKMFLMFNVEDPGFETAQEPSGHIKIEIRKDKGKLFLLTQNLKKDKNLNYKAYILKCEREQVLPVFMGNLALKGNRGELEWEFDPEDVEGTGSVVDDFNVAIVVAEYVGKDNKSILCPLVAYKNNKEVPWREKLQEAINAKKNKEMAAEFSEEFDIFSKYEGGIESVYGKSNTEGERDIFEDLGETVQGQESVGQEPAFLKEDKKNMEENGDIAQTEEKNANLRSENDDVCVNCFAEKNGKYGENGGGKCGLSMLKAQFHRYFEVSDPFRNKRKDYTWWKVNSPVYLNNILYCCSIKTPVLFNPKIMMSHFKYRHLIVGIYADEAKGKEYMVLGVPGAYGVDDKPFGDVCRWAQAEGGRPRYGAFGYWLVYIDPSTGQII